MKIRDSVAFVTGANRGLGLVFAQELLAAGARKVYAAARNPEHIPLQGAGSSSFGRYGSQCHSCCRQRVS
jgi:NAD(P)-dependent dehydrogenase (short-subunit alcohol dehydrogenase family)